jgi:energy-coupling factor transporter transmembrane protein EcfT
MKMPAWIKLLMLAALSVLIVAMPVQGSLISILAVALLIAALGASPIRLLRMLLPALPFVIAISAFQALLQGDLTIAGLSALRMTLLYLAGSAVTSTTGEAELSGAVERALRPMDRLTGTTVGKDISTMTMLALAFIPIVREEYASIKIAQEARGVRYRGFKALWGIAAVAVPLLYSLSRRADAIALAMEARCYGLDK